MKVNEPSITGQFTAEQLRQAADLLEQIETLQAEYDSLMSNGITAGEVTPSATHTKRKLSPQARAAIAEGQRKRWAKQNTFVTVPATIIKPESAPDKPSSESQSSQNPTPVSTTVSPPETVTANA